MQEFYRKALLALIVLVIADALLAAFFIDRSYLSFALLPAQKDGARWHYVAHSDATEGGNSAIRLTDPKRERLNFDFRMNDGVRYPFASAGLTLEDGKGGPGHADWSKYTNITFIAKCAPANSMILAISTFDEKISTPGDFGTYRSPGTFFSCSEKGTPVSLDLTRLIIPEWWLYSMKLDLSDLDYVLNKVSKIVFGTSPGSPRNVDSHAQISELTLHGRDYRYIAALVFIVLAGWCAFGWWFFRAYFRALTASIDSKMKVDLPLVAYRQLTLEPYKDKEKVAILRFIATNYTNTELDMESIVAGTSANRSKVNDVLKAELGMTFTSYVNKLRLTEAARLLAEKNNATVAEIAYSVGYGNVSYFNKLFKEEYGCPPKAFRTLATEPEKPGAEVPSLDLPA
jgi:AraC-like DNA-binding protein